MGMYLLVESYGNGVALAPIRLVATNKEDAVSEATKRFDAYRGRVNFYLYEMVPSGASITLIHTLTTD